MPDKNDLPHEDAEHTWVTQKKKKRERSSRGTVYRKSLEDGLERQGGSSPDSIYAPIVRERERERRLPDLQ